MTEKKDVTLREVLVSPNVPDRNLEAANLVDTTDRIASAIFTLAAATDKLADENRRQADALHNLVDAYRWHGERGD